MTKEQVIEANCELRKAEKLINHVSNELFERDLINDFMEGENLPEDLRIEYLSARVLLESAVAKNPLLSDAYNLLANSYWEIENDLERTLFFQGKALDLDPENETLIHSRTLVLMDLGRLDEAEREVERLKEKGFEIGDDLANRLARLKLGREMDRRRESGSRLDACEGDVDSDANTGEPVVPKTYEEWLSLTEEERELLKSRWDAYEGQSIGFPHTAGGRLAISSPIPVLEVRVGTYHGGEYVIHAYVADDALPSLPGKLEQSFEGFRVIWLPKTNM